MQVFTRNYITELLLELKGRRSCCGFLDCSCHDLGQVYTTRRLKTSVESRVLFSYIQLDSSVDIKPKKGR